MLQSELSTLQIIRAIQVGFIYQRSVYQTVIGIYTRNDITLRLAPMYMRQNEIAIPPDLYDRVVERLSHTDFNSVDEYVCYVVETAIANAETMSGSDDVSMEGEIENRLKSLGYLDDD